MALHDDMRICRSVSWPRSRIIDGSIVVLTIVSTVTCCLILYAFMGSVPSMLHGNIYYAFLLAFTIFAIAVMLLGLIWYFCGCMSTNTDPEAPPNLVTPMEAA